MAAGTQPREMTHAERITSLEDEVRYLRRVLERQRDRVDLILGTEPDVREEDMPQTRRAL